MVSLSSLVIFFFSYGGCWVMGVLSDDIEGFNGFWYGYFGSGVLVMGLKVCCLVLEVVLFIIVMVFFW